MEGGEWEERSEPPSLWLSMGRVRRAILLVKVGQRLDVCICSQISARLQIRAPC